MSPIGSAFARQVWGRHRTGLLAAGGVVLALAAAGPPLTRWAAGGRAGALPAFAVVAWIPGAAVVSYLMSVFLMADGPLGDMTSGYSRRLFARPVTTARLAAWPMAMGAVAVSLAWAALVVLVFRRSGTAVPLGPTTLGLVALLAWLQALSWTPFPFAWLGAIAASTAILGQGGAAWWLAKRGVPQGALAALAVGSAAMAYGVAVAGVGRARRGEGREPPRWLGRMGEAGARLWRSRAPYRSGAEAQLAFEWRNHGAILPLFVLLTLAIQLPILLIGHRLPPEMLAKLLAIPCVLPALLAGSVGASLPNSSPFWAPNARCFPFLATRPMTSGALAAAKFRMATRATLLAYAVAIAGEAAIILACGYGGDAQVGLERFLAPWPRAKAVGVVALVLLSGLILTWRTLTGSLVPGLTGRKFVKDLGAIGFAAAVMAMAGAGAWLATHPEHVLKVLAVAPWTIGGASTIKMFVTGLAFREALRRGLLTPAEAILAVGSWAILVAILLALGAWVVPRSALPMAPGVAALGVAVAVPIARRALAPLAVDWDRHG